MPRHILPNQVLEIGSDIQIKFELLEPKVFLAPYDDTNELPKTPAILRGRLCLRTLKVLKIQKIVIQFSGNVHTEWPEGITFSQIWV